MSSRSIARSNPAALAQWVGVGMLLSAAIYGLAHIDTRATGSPPEDPPGGRIILRTEVITVWLPRELLDQARCQTDPPVIHWREELRAHLERRGLRNAWYAMTSRGYQVNGGVAEITLIRRPHESPEYFGEFQAVMAIAAGRPPNYHDLDLSRATVGIIPDGMLTGEPRDAVIELTAQSDHSR
jgi:hypothetical protein